MGFAGTKNRRNYGAKLWSCVIHKIMYFHKKIILSRKKAANRSHRSNTDAMKWLYMNTNITVICYHNYHYFLGSLNNYIYIILYIIISTEYDTQIIDFCRFWVYMIFKLSLSLRKSQWDCNRSRAVLDHPRARSESWLLMSGAVPSGHRRPVHVYQILENLPTPRYSKSTKKVLYSVEMIIYNYI